MTTWQKSVEEHRDILERLAEHGQTRLAEDAQHILNQLEDE